MTKAPTNTPAVSVTPVTPENLKVWAALEVTDPSYTKPFNRSGFAGTAVNPTYISRRLTEVLGPNGVGWRLVIETEQFFETGLELAAPGQDPIKQVVHMVRAHLDWKDPASGEFHSTSPVYGATTLYQQRRDGSVVVDEECAKKTLTDCFSKAAVLLGAAADVHQGLYDDSKYVDSLSHVQPDVRKIAAPDHEGMDDPFAVPDPLSGRLQAPANPFGDAPVLVQGNIDPRFLAEKNDISMREANEAVEIVDHMENSMPVFVTPDDRAPQEFRDKAVATIELTFVTFVRTTELETDTRAFWRANRNALTFIKNAAPDAYERILKAFSDHVAFLKGTTP